MIEFDDVSVTYRGGVKALRNVSLTIDDGEFVVVVGLSGAGKSTLLRALNGLVPATSGSIKVNGTEVVGAKGAQLRKVRSQIGMIFQTFNLATRTTVMNNVLMGRLATVPTWRSTLGAVAGRRQGSCLRGARTGRHRRQGLRAGLEPVGRPAAAGRHRPGARPGAVGDARRRAGGGARPGHQPPGDG